MRKRCFSTTLQLFFCMTTMSVFADDKFPPADAVECRPRGGLPNFFRKLDEGKEVRIAYLGGSITEAAGWRVLSLKLFQEKYPKAKASEIKAAISGTDSDFGACRLEREVLKYKPDLLFVEFASNDAGMDPSLIVQTMEGIVRKTWKNDPLTDICFVYTLTENNVETLNGGKFQRSASAMERVADKYGIPSIHMGLEVARLAKEGKLVFKGEKPKTDEERTALGDRILFSSDGTHPYTDTGHPLYLAAIERSLPSLKPAGKPGTHKILEKPLDENNWENARLVPLADLALQGQWRKLAQDDTAYPQASKYGAEFYVAGKTGDSITFRFKGRNFGLYGLKGPDLGQFSVTVDDGRPFVATTFDGYSTEGRYRIKPWFYPKPLADAEHIVKIELIADPPEKAKILKQRGISIKDPRQFEANRLYVSDVLVVGQILK